MPEFTGGLVALLLGIGVVAYIALVVATGMFLAYRKGYNPLWAFYLCFWLNIIGLLWIYLGKPNERELRSRWADSAPFKAALALVERCEIHLRDSATLAELRVALGREGITSINGKSIAALAQGLHWEQDDVQARLRLAAIQGLDRRGAPVSEYAGLLNDQGLALIHGRLALILAERNDTRGVDILIRSLHDHAPYYTSNRGSTDDVARREGLVIGRLFRERRLSPDQHRWVSHNQSLIVYNATGYLFHPEEAIVDDDSEEWDSDEQRMVTIPGTGEVVGYNEAYYGYDPMPITLRHCIDLDDPESVLFVPPKHLKGQYPVRGGPYDRMATTNYKRIGRQP